MEVALVGAVGVGGSAGFRVVGGRCCGCAGGWAAVGLGAAVDVAYAAVGVALTQALAGAAVLYFAGQPPCAVVAVADHVDCGLYCLRGWANHSQRAG